MKKNKAKERIYTVLFMLGLTLITVSAVSGLQIATHDIVERNQKLYEQRAVLNSAAIDLPESPEEIADLYARTVEVLGDGIYGIGDGAKRVFLRSGAGLWGEIQAVVCFDTANGALVGVTFIKDNETPGLGGRINEEWFQDQFRGKSAPLELVPEGTESSDPRKIDAITGATITSKAVRDLVNSTYREMNEPAPSETEQNQ